MVDHAPGTLILQRYRIIRSRAMRRAYPGVLLAVDEHLGCTVDVVVAPAPVATPDGALFARRAQALGALHHPTLPEVLDIGVQQRYTVLVCHHVAGYSLAAALRRGDAPGTATAALLLVAELAAALGLVHARGLCHGAIDADSVVLDSAGQPVLVDLAWSHLAARRGAPAPGVRAGYLPSPSDDVLALGRLLASLLQAVRPGVLVETRPGVEKLLRQALAPWPDERFATGTEMAQAISWALAPPDTIRRPVPAPAIRSVATPARAPLQQRQSHALLVPLALGLALLLGPAVMHSLPRPPPVLGFRMHHHWGWQRDLSWRDGAFGDRPDNTLPLPWGRDRVPPMRWDRDRMVPTVPGS